MQAMRGELKEWRAYPDFSTVVDGLRRENSASDADCLSLKLQVPPFQYLLRLLPVCVCACVLLAVFARQLDARNKI